MALAVLRRVVVVHCLFEWKKGRTEQVHLIRLGRRISADDLSGTNMLSQEI